eukprot:TRINITY_DN5539_c0_g1_i1.p1 TRINITY_DN5539_c0_g1~~TRINITY_DN5539_c0_g1_i1.p1  ORF type:complete len:618 (+),score=145.25 TRINITY_DN5539_c0_g1_i1:90-1856(+)
MQVQLSEEKSKRALKIRDVTISFPPSLPSQPLLLPQTDPLSASFALPGPLFDVQMILMFPTLAAWEMMKPSLLPGGVVSSDRLVSFGKEALVFEWKDPSVRGSSWSAPCLYFSVPETFPACDVERKFQVKFSRAGVQKENRPGGLYRTAQSDHRFVALEDFTAVACLFARERSEHVTSGVRIISIASLDSSFNVVSRDEQNVECTMVKLNLHGRRRKGHKLVYHSKFDKKKRSEKKLKRKLTLRLTHTDQLSEAMKHYSSPQKMRLKIKGPLTDSDVAAIQSALRDVIQDKRSFESRTFVIKLEWCSMEENEKLTSALESISGPVEFEMCMDLMRMDEEGGHEILGDVEQSTRAEPESVYACGREEFFEMLSDGLTPNGRIECVKWKGPMSVEDANLLVDGLEANPPITKLRIPAGRSRFLENADEVFARRITQAPIRLRFGGTLRHNCRTTRLRRGSEPAYEKLLEILRGRNFRLTGSEARVVDISDDLGEGVDAEYVDKFVPSYSPSAPSLSPFDSHISHQEDEVVSGRDVPQGEMDFLDFSFAGGRNSPLFSCAPLLHEDEGLGLVAECSRDDVQHQPSKRRKEM